MNVITTPTRAELKTRIARFDNVEREYGAAVLDAIRRVFHFDSPVNRA